MLGADLRPQLEAIAEGKRTRSKAPDVLNTGIVEKHHAAFRAWAIFSNNQGREPLAAPSALLTPLP